MNQGFDTEEFKFEYIIDKDYVNDILANTYSIELSDDEWLALHKNLPDPLHFAVHSTIEKVLRYSILLEKNEDAASVKPHYLVKSTTRHDDIYGWKELRQRFETETDAQEFIDYNKSISEDEDIDWRIEKVD